MLAFEIFVRSGSRAGVVHRGDEGVGAEALSDCDIEGGRSTTSPARDVNIGKASAIRLPAAIFVRCAVHRPREKQSWLIKLWGQAFDHT